jgi:hypothetical protein
LKEYKQFAEVPWRMLRERRLSRSETTAHALDYKSNASGEHAWQSLNDLFEFSNVRSPFIIDGALSYLSGPETA